VIKWLSSKEANIELWRTGSLVPRLSARAELAKRDPEFKVVTDSYDRLGGYIWAPDRMLQIPEWPELSFKIEAAFVEVWTKQKPLQKALDDAAIEVRGILERAGYYK
jgi:ABC-type glycerol-3-phosphate transport system substrate-binding protein